MTRTIATHVRNINETFSDIFMSIPLGYIVYYHCARDKYVMKKKQNISR